MNEEKRYKFFKDFFYAFSCLCASTFFFLLTRCGHVQINSLIMIPSYPKKTAIESYIIRLTSVSQ